MAAARRKTGGRRPPARGRVTPSNRATPASPTAKPAAPNAGEVGQPGRRPSSPGFLLLVSLLWIVGGVVILTSSSASWKLIPGVVSIGIGLLFLRGAAATVARRTDRRR